MSVCVFVCVCACAQSYTNPLTLDGVAARFTVVSYAGKPGTKTARNKGWRLDGWRLGPSTGGEDGLVSRALRL